ncbi:hypothetical protein IJF86_00955 [Candidatus Saccharibacteria bacterium]|nr:hypothetical protein [Candidatus Saccharibacteria bacterium]MBQ2659982.1 hypothetical protein [Candidatus Saccharibacteria bacterium]
MLSRFSRAETLQVSDFLWVTKKNHHHADFFPSTTIFVTAATFKPHLGGSWSRVIEGEIKNDGKTGKGEKLRAVTLSPNWGSGGVPQRKGLRDFCKTFRPRKILERMGMKKPQCFLPVRARLLKCSCAKEFLVSRR